MPVNPGGQATPIKVRAVRLPLQTRIESTVVLARRGMLRPVRPDRAARAGLAFIRWGVTPATAGILNGITRPDATAVIGDTGSITWQELDCQTNALARGFAELGLQSGERIAILCRNGIELVESLVASAKLGGHALMLNTSFAADELKGVLERERPQVLVYDGEFASLVRDSTPAGVSTVVAAPGDEPAAERTLAALRDSHPDTPLDPPAEEGRMVILTSGTTGAPKGARIARASGLEPLAWYLSVVPIQAGSVALIPAPLFHAHGLGQFTITTALGCTVVLPHAFDAEQTLSLIAQHRVEVLVVVPTMLKRIMDLDAETRGRYDTDTLRVVVCSGSALDPKLARAFMSEFGPVVYNLYGSTEVAWATIATPQDLLEAPGTVGRPPPHTRLAILDEAGNVLPPGATGHIFVAHEMLFEGYTDPAKDRARVDGMLTPGDLGHVDEQGRLFIDSREDDMIVSGGENVYPGQVEEVLREHPDVTDAVVLGVEDERFGQRLVAFVVPRAGSGLREDDALSFSREHLARFKVPREVHLRDDFPRNALGKVLRRKLQTDEEGKWQTERR
jgi:acyl-CoA synthetase (AMP-forming)/AMP-acid ligase II